MELDQKLDLIVERHEEIGARMSADGLSSDDRVALAKEYSELTSVVQRIEAVRKLQHEIQDLAGILADPSSDPEMRELATGEFAECRARLPELEHALKLALLPRDEADEKNVILEIRAGTGGDEAALFGASLLRMQWRTSVRCGVSGPSARNSRYLTIR